MNKYAEADLDGRLIVIKTLQSNHPNTCIVSNPISSIADMCWISSRKRINIEVKRLNHDSKIPQVLMEQSKYNSLFQLGEDFLYIVVFNDGVMNVYEPKKLVETRQYEQKTIRTNKTTVENSGEVEKDCLFFKTNSYSRQYLC